ncbi:hypothetical protein MPSEU_000815500 [Mayamaea pseudoterrestris]|nr:hypothetical protein MPSEU_000815500 [Mayamaea pseudoterrestris]
MMTSAMLQSIQDEDWVQKPLTIIVVPGLSQASMEKVFPSLFTLFETQLKTDFEVWALDTKDISTQAFQEEYIAPQLPHRNDEFLDCCIYKHISKLDDWRTLTQLFQQTSLPHQNVAVWFADVAQNHTLNETVFMATKRITPSILQGWNRVIFEPPLSHKEKISWDETKHLYRLHPLLASTACQQVWAFRQRPWTRSLWNARAVQSVHVQVRTQSSVYSMLPQLYHVACVVAMEIKQPLEDLSIHTARAIVLAKISPYCRSIDLMTGKRAGAIDNEKKVTTTTKSEPTYVCVRCWIQSDTWTGVPFFLEIMQHELPNDTVEIRLALQDATDQDALVFGEHGASFVMAPISGESPLSDSRQLAEMHMTGNDSDKILDGRSRLALDAFRGKKLLFVHGKELTALHSIVDPLIRQCNSVVAESYESVEGPASRLEFLKDIRPPKSV